MVLKSHLFRDDAKLNACLVLDASHVTHGALGEHVGKIQVALMDLDGLTISRADLDAKRYGTSTAAAVLAYKKKRKIINPAYQSHEDDIVGKMTIASLDRDMIARQKPNKPGQKMGCGRNCGCGPPGPDKEAAMGRARLVVLPGLRSRLA